MNDLRLLRWAIFSSFVFLTLPAYVQDHSECQDESFFLSNENLPYCEEGAAPLPPPEPPCIYEEPLPLYDDTLPYCEEEAAPLPPPEPPCIYEEPLPLYDDTLPYCEEEATPLPPPEPPCIYEEPLPLYDDTLPYCEEEVAPLPPPEPPCIYEEPEPFYEDDLPYCEETTSKPVKEERCECIEEKPIPPKKTLDAIIILGQDEELLESQDLANASGVETCGFVLPTSSDILEQRLEPFFYKSLREKDILIDLKTELYKYFQDYNEPFVLVLIPGQTVQFTTKPQTPKPPPKEYYEWGRKELRQEACERPAPAPAPKPQEECAPEEPVFFEEVYECEELAPAPAPKPQEEECAPEEPVFFEEVYECEELAPAPAPKPQEEECAPEEPVFFEEVYECEEPAPAPTPKPQEEECAPEEPVFFEEVYECEEPALAPAPKPQEECVPEEPVNIDPCYFEENRSKHTSFMVQNKKLSIADNEIPADWEIEFGEAETICEDDGEGLDEEECECQKAEPPVTNKSEEECAPEEPVFFEEVYECEELEPAPAPKPQEEECEPEEPVFIEEVYECEELEPTPAPKPQEEECEPEEPVFVEEVYECEELAPASPPAAKKEQVEEICEEELEPAAPAKQMTVLQVKVIRAKLGEVFVSGAPERYKNEITTKHGEEIYPRNIQKDLNWINRQPFQRADVIYQAGQKSGETDLILSMDRRKPWRVYAGTDATGVQTIGRGRVFSGVDVAVPYGLISCQYSNSYDWTKYHTVTGQYTAFLPWRHVLSVYGGYSIVHASLPYPGSRNEGTSSQGSFRYTIPLPPKATLVHDFSFGGDFKNTNNTLQFSEFFPVYAQQVNLTQVALAYQGGWEQNRSRIDYQALINFSPGSWLPNMSNADYSSLRPGATHKWIYAKGDVRFVHKTVDGFGIHIRGQFQVTSQNLLPSEQLGIGGYDTVRGYDERQLNFDEGFIGSIEWRTPATPMMTRFREHKTKDSIQFLAFLDYGVGKNHNPIPGETNGEYLFGVGPGVRYTIDPWIACRLDWGFKLHRLPGFTGGSSEAHFSVIASY